MNSATIQKYKLSCHANQRMQERGLDYDDVCEGLERGEKYNVESDDREVHRVVTYYEHLNEHFIFVLAGNFVITVMPATHRIKEIPNGLLVKTYNKAMGILTKDNGETPIKKVFNESPIIHVSSEFYAIRGNEFGGWKDIEILPVSSISLDGIVEKVVNLRKIRIGNDCNRVEAWKGRKSLKIDDNGKIIEKHRKSQNSMTREEYLIKQGRFAAQVYAPSPTC